MAALIPYCYKYSVLILYVFWPDVQQKNVQKSSSILDAILGKLLYGVTFEHSGFTVFTHMIYFEKTNICVFFYKNNTNIVNAFMSIQSCQYKDLLVKFPCCFYLSQFTLQHC